MKVAFFTSFWPAQGGGSGEGGFIAFAASFLLLTDVRPLAVT